MRDIRSLRFLLLITAILTFPLAAGPPKRGWTKVVLTHAGGSARALIPHMLEKRGGELLVDGESYAVAYVPAAAVAAFQADAGKYAITIAPRDDFDVLLLPSAARLDVRVGDDDTVPKEERIAHYPAGKPGLYLIQFVAPVRSEWVAELVAMGWTMTRYIPANGYVIIGPPALAGRTRQLSYIQFLDFFHPYQKAKQLVRDGVARDLVFELASLPDPSEPIEAIRALAETVEVHRGEADTLVYARLAHGAAEALMHHPLVISVSPRPFGALSDERQVMSLTTNLNAAGSAPTNPTSYTTWLSGRCPACSSMSPPTWRVGLADTGVDDGTRFGGHPDLADRKYFGSRIYTYNDDTCTAAGNLDCDRYGHGTIVAGIMVGNANTNERDDGGSGFYWGMGVAPWAGVLSTKILTATAQTSLDFSRLHEFTRDAANHGVTIQNHSFNEYNTLPNQSGLYSALARQYDIAVRDADGALSSARVPLLIAVSAGNNTQGYFPKDRVLGGGTAKNVISMGGAENHRPGLVNCIAPGDDFRNIMQSSRTSTLLPNYIKPDLVAPAAPVASTNSSELTSNTGYCIDDLHPDFQYNGDSGTSFAAPVAAASALIVKRYLGATPSATSPALAKAMLIAGAKSIRGGIDRAANPDIPIGPFPNGQQGFGRISFDDIITGATPPVWYDESANRKFINAGTQPFRIRLRVRDASKPVKVALVWTDAPGTAYVQNPLVNDLDLELYPSSSLTHRLVGNYLQVVDTNRGEESIPVPHADGAQGRDRTNNVEVVRTFLSANEEFDVLVNGFSISGDTDGNGATFEQDFALVALNADPVNGGNPIAPSVTASRTATDPQQVHVEWTPATNIMNPLYQIWRGTTLANMTNVAQSVSLTYEDTGRPMNTTFLYRIVAVGNGGASATSNNTFATTISWAPHDSLTAVVTKVLAQQWLDLRRGVDYVRTAASLSTNSWALPIAPNALIRASQLSELRTKLLEAYTTLSVPAPTFTTPAPTPNVTRPKPEDVVDLRKAVE